MIVKLPRALTAGFLIHSPHGMCRECNGLARRAEIDLEGGQTLIAAELIKGLRSRVRFLLNVGFGYLSLDRSGPSLSGGESQRLRLASQMGTELTGVLYVLDDPSIGLHQRDNRKLLAALFLR